MPPKLQRQQSLTGAKAPGQDELWERALDLYHGQNGVEKDEKKAFELFYRLSNQGHNASMKELACMYFMGLGCEKSFIQAKKWFSREELQEDSEALYGLGLIHHIGREEEGLDPEPNEAIKCWRKAASLNNFNAVQALESFYPEWFDGGNKTPSHLYDSDSDSTTTPKKAPMSPLQRHVMNKNVTDLSLTVSSDGFLSTAESSGRRNSIMRELQASSNHPSSPLVRSKPKLQLKVPSKRSGGGGGGDGDEMKKTIDVLRNQLMDLQASFNVLNTQFIEELSSVKKNQKLILEKLDQLTKKS